MNIGFDQASKRKEFDCFMFHDVDLILENDKAIYNCFNDEKIVWHYSGYIDKFKYRLLYQYLFGGSKLKHLVLELSYFTGFDGQILTSLPFQRQDIIFSRQKSFESFFDVIIEWSDK